MHNAHPVVAVLLAYRMEPAAVAANLGTLGASVRALVVVDNSGSRDAQRWQMLAGAGRDVLTVMNGCNTGVAAGWNAGIRLALEQGAEFVLLLDEDSVPGPEMVPRLTGAWQSLAPAHALAAVGPDFRDRTTGAGAMFVTLSRFGISRRCCSAGDTCLASDYLMSSGTLVHRSVFDAVGFMDERLFIDYVDTEWCLRARSMGRECFGVCGAHMEHAFGSQALAVPFGNGRKVPDRDPVRSYYIYRNACLLLGCRHCPVIWKLNELRRLALLPALYLLRSPRRWQHLHMMLRGVADALRGRTGALSAHPPAGP